MTSRFRGLVTSQSGESRPVSPTPQHSLSRQDHEKIKNVKSKPVLKPQDDQLDFHTQHSVQTTSVQDLNPRPYTDNIHMCSLVHEMILIEPGIISWTNLVSSLGVQIPTLIGPHQQCVRRVV
jgi:hypothetical protein